jgi:hypothetical protein
VDCPKECGFGFESERGGVGRIEVVVLECAVRNGGGMSESDGGGED